MARPSGLDCALPEVTSDPVPALVCLPTARAMAVILFAWVSAT
jgi:hypothetical protein